MAESATKDTVYKVVGVLAGVAIILGGRACFSRISPSPIRAEAPLTGLALIMDAAKNQKAGITVQHWGTVTKLVDDHADGSGGGVGDGSDGTLQKFVVTLENGHVLLMAHDTAIAPRIPLVVDDVVEFRGRYDWNALGGLVYFTHHDPEMVRDDGWIRYKGKVYR